MDDKQAILAELDRMIFDVCVKAWESKAQYVQGLRNDVSADIDTVVEFIQRCYEQAPVKMRYSFGDWLRNDYGHVDFQDAIRMEKAWNAALANAQTGGRFEVGDVAMLGHDRGRIGFKPDDEEANWWSFSPDAVQPIPKTVDLTAEERIEQLSIKSGLISGDIRSRVFSTAWMIARSRSLGLLASPTNTG